MNSKKDTEKLALDGGAKAIIEDQSCLEWPILPESAKEYVNEILNEKPAKISTNPITDIFTEEFCDYIGVDMGIPMVNGTSALLSAFTVLGVGPGDEIICPSYTYWATAMPASYLGAKIIFAEIDPISLCIDPDDVEKKITDNTKVVVPVHVWGMPCEMDRIMKLAKENDLFIIEDASHAHGASYKGDMVGSFGDISVFSLQATKLMPAGEGGLLLTNNLEYFEKALAMGHYERLSSPYLLPSSDYIKYHRTTTHGFKFRMSPLHAAIGLAYLETLDKDNALRNKNCKKIRSKIDQIPGFHAFTPPDNVKRVYYENVIEYRESETGISKEKVVEALKAEGAQLSENRYPLLHQQPYFKERGYDGDELTLTDKIVGRLIRIPNFSAENEKLLDQYIKAFHKIDKNLL